MTIAVMIFLGTTNVHHEYLNNSVGMSESSRPEANFRVLLTVIYAAPCNGVYPLYLDGYLCFLIINYNGSQVPYMQELTRQGFTSTLRLNNGLLVVFDESVVKALHYVYKWNV